MIISLSMGMDGLVIINPSRKVQKRLRRKAVTPQEPEKEFLKIAKGSEQKRKTAFRLQGSKY